MRTAIAAIALTLGARGPAATPPAAPETAQDAPADSSGVARVPEAPFTLESEALVGLWSLQRDCSLFDLVFNADGVFEYYDYSDDLVVPYRGTWATADNNRVVITMHRVGENNARLSEDVVYNLDVAAPVSDDLVGRFAPADGADARAVSALRCVIEEDRD